MVKKWSPIRRKKTDTTDKTPADPTPAVKVNAPTPRTVERKPAYTMGEKATPKPKVIEKPVVVEHATKPSEPDLVGPLAYANGTLPKGRTFFTNEYLNKWQYSGTDLKRMFGTIEEEYSTIRGNKPPGFEPILEDKTKKLQELRILLRALGYTL